MRLLCFISGEMRRPLSVPLVMLSAVWCAAHVAAQSVATSSPAPTPTVSPLAPVAPKPAPASPVPERAISSTTADKLAAARPKLPPLVQPAAPRPAAETPDLRETDKPANGIVRLPSYIVREKTTKPPVFREQDIYTRQAFARRLAKRYYSEGYLAFSKLVGYTPLVYIFGSAEGNALAQFRDEEQLRNKIEFTDYSNMLMTSDPATGAKFKNEVRETFMHWSEMGWSSGPK